MGKSSHGISKEVLEIYASQVIEIVNEGCEVAVVIGGGNIFRGLIGTESGFDRVKGDQMGMLATIINSLAFESEIKNRVYYAYIPREKNGDADVLVNQALNKIYLF